MKDNKLSVSVNMYIAILVFMFVNPISTFQYIVLDVDYVLYSHMYMLSDIAYIFDLEKFAGFFTEFILKILVYGTPILGLCSALTKKKNGVLVANILMIVWTIVTLFSKAKVTEYYFNEVKFAWELWIILILVIVSFIITLTVTNNVMPITNNVMPVTNGRVNAGVASVNNMSANISNINVADELKKLKELLDSDVITKEEFEKKKQQLL